MLRKPLLSTYRIAAVNYLIFGLPANPERIGYLAVIVVEKQEIINRWQLCGHSHRKLPSIKRSDSLVLLLNIHHSYYKIKWIREKRKI
jgi:hypothetical protein